MKPAKTGQLELGITAGPSTEIVVTPTGAPGALTSAMQRVLLEDAESTPAFEREDIAIPFLRVAQANSPELKEEDAKYITGLKQGYIFNTVTGQFWPGKEGVLVMPCAFSRSYMEWRPRKMGGGLIKDWGNDPERLSVCTKHPETGRDMTPEGNELVASALYYALIVDEAATSVQQVAFVLASTQLRKARRWNTQMQAITIPGPNGPVTPAFHYMTYTIRTVPEKNEKGEWHGVVITPHRPTLQLANGEVLYMAGRSFKQLVDSGDVKLHVVTDEPELESEDGGAAKKTHF